jgi:hypothetical protein
MSPVPATPSTAGAEGAGRRGRDDLVVLVLVVLVVAAAEGAPDRPRLDQQREQLGDQAGEEEQQCVLAHLLRPQEGRHDEDRDQLDQVADHQRRSLYA